MSETFWNFLDLGVVIFVYVIIYLHKRRCRKRNIAFTKPFAGMEKYEKRISKAMDYFLITIILLAVVVGVPIIFRMFWIWDPDPVVQHCLLQHQLPLGFLMLSFLSWLTTLLFGLLSPFHTNITIKKRRLLLVMVSVPFCFFLFYFVSAGLAINRAHIKPFVIFTIPVLLIYLPPIAGEKSFTEFYPLLANKILSFPKTSPNTETQTE